MAKRNGVLSPRQVSRVRQDIYACIDEICSLAGTNHTAALKSKLKLDFKGYQWNSQDPKARSNAANNENITLIGEDVVSEFYSAIIAEESFHYIDHNLWQLASSGTPSIPKIEWTQGLEFAARFYSNIASHRRIGGEVAALAIDVDIAEFCLMEKYEGFAMGAVRLMKWAGDIKRMIEAGQIRRGGKGWEDVPARIDFMILAYIPFPGYSEFTRGVPEAFMQAVTRFAGKRPLDIFNAPEVNRLVELLNQYRNAFCRFQSGEEHKYYPHADALYAQIAAQQGAPECLAGLLLNTVPPERVAKSDELAMQAVASPARHHLPNPAMIYPL